MPNRVVPESQLLHRIIKEVTEISAAKEQPLAIFDLDSTLFDVSPRIAKILHEFASDPLIQVRHPFEARKLRNVKPHSSDFGVRKTFSRAGLDPQDCPDFFRSAVEFWHRMFFADHHLRYDQPYPGALEFVRDLSTAGARIMYLSGRDIPRMKQGTVESLLQHGFPLDTDHGNLILKPRTGEDDALFKKQFFDTFADGQQEIWFFENEPANINLILEHAQRVRVIFFDSVHAGLAVAPTTVPTISSWQR